MAFIQKWILLLLFIFSFSCSMDEPFNQNKSLSSKTINRTDAFSSNYSQVYLRGTFNDWSTLSMTLTGNNLWEAAVTFRNTSNERFKFDIYGNWSLNYGDTNKDGIGDQNGSDITAAALSVCTITFNDITRQYTVKKQGEYSKTYSQVYLRGTFNSWSTKPMTLVSDYTWQSEVTFDSGSNTRFKLDIYGNWTLNFGDTNRDGIADQNGSDIPVTSGMKYTITFNDSTRVYQVTLSNPVRTDIKALVLVDKRLYDLLKTEIDTYIQLAQTRRGFSVGLLAIQGADDYTPLQLKDLIKQHYTQSTVGLEGVLFIGNLKLPSFYKNRTDCRNVRLISRFYEDLDGVFEKRLPEGSLDTEDQVNNTVPAHDYDYVSKGANPDPEIWLSVMPVGLASGNTYTAWADQLRPYLQKVTRYYRGELGSPNGRYYYVSNDKGEDFLTHWNTWTKNKIDFYGKNDPSNPSADKYVRWPLENFNAYDEFEAEYNRVGWAGEGWQLPSIYINHMNSTFYQVSEVNVHSWEGGSLVSTAEAKAITGAGLLMALDGCSVAGFYQFNSPSSVDTYTAVDENIMTGFLYGQSKCTAILGDTFLRGHYAHYPTLYREMLMNSRFLGHANLLRLKKLYQLSGSDVNVFKENGMEFLMGDPFMDFQ